MQRKKNFGFMDYLDVFCDRDKSQNKGKRIKHKKYIIDTSLNSDNRLSTVIIHFIIYKL